jgi:hypothetical protein
MISGQPVLHPRHWLRYGSLQIPVIFWPGPGVFGPVRRPQALAPPGVSLDLLPAFDLHQSRRQKIKDPFAFAPKKKHPSLLAYIL